jgi:hypothetical protein
VGSWGEKPFDNDDALDWLAGFEGEGVDGLRELLSKVAATPEDQYMDVDDGNAAVAAAEIVAAALGDRRDHLPPADQRWLDANPGAIRTNDRTLARRAMERVLGPNSELPGLWDDDGQGDEWLAGMLGLMARLGADPEVASLEVKAARAARAARAKVVGRAKMTEEGLAMGKQILLMSLDRQGLRPTDAQRARIQASRDGDEINRWLSRLDDAPSVDAVLDEPKPKKPS